jgi:chaperonin GroEL
MDKKKENIIFEQNAKLKLLNGITLLSDIVSETLGPKGRNVTLANFGFPKTTNDSNIIVEDIELKDKFENMGIFIAKDMASKIKEKCGDGTTRAILLLKEILENSLKNVSSGTSPVYIKNGLEKILPHLLKKLEEMAIPIKDEKDLSYISSSDPQIEKILFETFKKVGKDGIITIKKSTNTETKIEITEGVKINKGYLSSYFCNNLKKLTVEMENPYILLANKKISSIQEILPLLQIISPTKKDLLIIADDIDKDVLSTLVINKTEKILSVAAIKAPSFSDERLEILEDIAALTKATVFSEEKGTNLRKIELKDLGQAEKIIITKDDTVIINGFGNKNDTNKRILK